MADIQLTANIIGSVFVSAATAGIDRNLSAAVESIAETSCLAVAIGRNLSVAVESGSNTPDLDVSHTISIQPRVVMPWTQYPGIIDVDFQEPWGVQNTLDVIWGAVWEQQDISDVENVLPWGRLGQLDVNILSPWQTAAAMDVLDCLPWSSMAVLDPEIVFPWAAVNMADVDFQEPWCRVLDADISTVLVWSARLAVDVFSRASWSRMQITDVPVKLPWARTLPVDVAVFHPFVQGAGCVQWQNLLVSENIPWRAVARIIMSKQNIIFYRVSDNEPVHIINLKASIDLDSWAWSFSGTLPSKADADLVRPGADGNREIEVYLSINGYEFKFFVRGISENYTWAKGTYSFEGRSKSVIFGEEYCPKITQIFDAGPVQSVVADILQDTGWTWDWNLLENTWNLDDGSLSVVNATKMDVLSLIAKAVGGTIATDPATNTLKFMSRMPISPENWAAADVDQTILSGIMSQGVAADPKPGYNQVIVSGKETGVIATCRRTGTAGDIPAPSIIDPLLTNQAVITERGRVELAENGFDFVDETILLPLPGVGHAPALLLPGSLVEITDLFSTWTGMVKAVSIFAETAKTRQRVTIKRLSE